MSADVVREHEPGGGLLRQLGIDEPEDIQSGEARRVLRCLVLVDRRPCGAPAVVGRLQGPRRLSLTRDRLQRTVRLQQRLLQPVGHLGARLVVGEVYGVHRPARRVARVDALVARRGAEIDVRQGLVASADRNVALVRFLGNLEPGHRRIARGDRPAALGLRELAEDAIDLAGVRRQAAGHRPGIVRARERERLLGIRHGQRVHDLKVEAQERLRFGPTAGLQSVDQGDKQQLRPSQDHESRLFHAASPNHAACVWRRRARRRRLMPKTARTAMTARP